MESLKESSSLTLAPPLEYYGYARFTEEPIAESYFMINEDHKEIEGCTPDCVGLQKYNDSSNLLEYLRCHYEYILGILVYQIGCRSLSCDLDIALSSNV